MTTHAATHHRSAGASPLERWALPLVVALTFAAVVSAVLLARGGGTGEGSTATGSAAPDFRAYDVVSGRDMTLADLQGKTTLLFFSEGASCQACLVQISDLQSESRLRDEGIQLVSVSTDPPAILSQAAREYGITTPLLSDSSTQMSSAYGMLGRGGMGHPGADGHAFMLLDRDGRIAWQQAYSQMYVEPTDLLAELPR
jgi:peroxiredoxin